MVELAKVALRLKLKRLSSWFLLGLISVSSVYADESLTILSQNLKRFFDDVDDGNRVKIESPGRYQQRIKIAAEKLLVEFNAPDIVALQEVENINVLREVAAQVSKSGGPSYQPVLLEGNDVSGIDVGYLVQSNLTIKTRRQLFKRDRINSDGPPLFSRPPLLIEVCKTSCITLVNLHLRSMRGLGNTNKGKRVAIKRLSQATRLAKWIDRFQIQHSAKSIIILGDFNALQPPDRFSDIVGTLIGEPINGNRLYPTKDWIEQDLIDLTKRIKPSERFSYVYKGERQILDYILANRSFEAGLKRIIFSDIDREFSDHAGLLAEFNW